MPSARRARCAGRCTAFPILIKDNVDIAGMVNSAGSLALADNRPAADAFMVDAPARGRRGDSRQDQPQRVGELPLDALVVRLELARRPDEESVRARSQSVRLELRHRHARSPRALRAIGVGTETDGSIICPSSVNGLVGLKPTVGLVSRTGIIPISVSQDTAGPMARTVSDVALLLTAMAGVDPADPSGAGGHGKIAADYTTFLKADALKGKRFGVRAPGDGLSPRCRCLDDEGDRRDQGGGRRGDRRQGRRPTTTGTIRSSRCCSTSSRTA